MTLLAAAEARQLNPHTEKAPMTQSTVSAQGCRAGGWQVGGYAHRSGAMRGNVRIGQARQCTGRWRRTVPTTMQPGSASEHVAWPRSMASPSACTVPGPKQAWSP